MPELPEVETVRIGLKNLIIGKRIQSVEYDWLKSFPNAKHDVEAFVVGAKVANVRRRAKVLLIDLSSKYTLVIHLKMTGQLVFRSNNDKEAFGAGHPNDSLIGALPDKSTRVIMDFGDSKLFFNDQRKFGWIKLFPTIEVPNIDFFKKFGPEPLSEDFTAQEFVEGLKRRANTSIKAALLDQTVVAGVGNIYADESLFAAKIHPATSVKNVSEQKLKKLFVELQSILRMSIEKGGSTDKNYVNVEGRRGNYLDFAQVFRKNAQPCPKCGTIIEKIKVAGRGTHICPNCQKISRRKQK